MGIYNQFIHQWGQIHSAFIKTNTGRVLVESTPNYDLPLVCIHRAHLHGVLLNQIPKEKLFANHKLVQLDSKEKQSELHFENGATINADLVIGADGINSEVRKFIINDGPPIFRGYNIWRGIAQLNDFPAGYSSETWGKGKRIGIVPIRDNKFGWWATVNEAENANNHYHNEQEKLSNLFKNWHDPIPRLFTNSPKLLKIKLVIVSQ